MTTFRVLVQGRPVLLTDSRYRAVRFGARPGCVVQRFTFGEWVTL